VVQPHRDLRYERKARGTELSYFELEHRVRTHPALFREIFFERKVNNVYLDTVDLASFEENVSGIQDRAKLRVRWYGELSGEIERPVLEIKFKTNMVGGKQRFPLTPLTLSSRFEGRKLIDWLRAHALPGAVRSHLASQEPRLLNRYSRRYFQSQDGRFRITLDRHLEYYRLHAGRNLLLQRRSDPDDVVIEMKYRVEDDRLADDASSHVPFQWTKSSKYVTGIEGLWWPGSR
jgi:SPX domain protein involved in polyphosphate accumulation